jgi:hypothetical protein
MGPTHPQWTRAKCCARISALCTVHPPQTITAALQDLQKRYGELDYTRCQNGKLEPSPHRLLGEYNLRNSAGSILCTMPLEMKVATVVTHPPGLGI